MRRFRFTLAQLMAIVLVIGFGFAALRNANALWASATFSLAILTVSVAIAGACSRKEGARMPWAGFAVAGGLYLMSWLSSSSTNGPLYGTPDPLLYRLLYMLRPYINPETSSGSSYIAYTHISHSLETVLFGCIGAILGRLLAVKDDRPKS
jgi:hypothetical protein